MEPQYKFRVERYGGVYDILEYNGELLGIPMWVRRVLSLESVEKLRRAGWGDGETVYRSNNFDECMEYVDDMLD